MTVENIERQSGRIHPAKAAAAAKDFFREVTGYQANDLTLEEVQLSDDGRRWLITLGHREAVPVSVGLSWPATGMRDYKLFEVDASSGAVVSMKIRKV